MLRFPPTQIFLTAEDIASADLRDRADLVATNSVLRPPHGDAIQPSYLSASTDPDDDLSSNFSAAMSDNSALSHLPHLATSTSPADNDNENLAMEPPLPTPIPYTHLSYGPDREAIVLRNLHASHLAQIRYLHATPHHVCQPALFHELAYHEQVRDGLKVCLAATNLQLTISDWRHHVRFSTITNDDAANTDQPNPATDLPLLSRYANYRFPPLSRLTKVKAAESATEPGRRRCTELNPPISVLLGIQGQGYLRRVPAAGGFCGLYGDEADVRQFMGLAPKPVAEGPERDFEGEGWVRKVGM